MLTPLKKTKLYEEIVSQLLSLIKNGTLKPGDRLPPERKLSEMLNVSRTALREALRSMETMGYIKSKVGGGTFINSISFENVMDPFSVMLSQDKKLLLELIDVRRLLESEIASLAAKRITPEKAKLIQNAIDEMEKEVAGGGTGLNGDNAFHNALAKAAENSAMSIIIDMCSELLSRTREATLIISGHPELSIIDHKRIFEAINSGNSREAFKRMREHLLKAQLNIEKKK